ncbi:MAG: glutamine--fructose-6-phosphate transaminase (isomerizing) [Burkholderiales bacterium]|nr:glutamine--fructose-6-phosphate transaminase (isomerizing) [Burkholderiales bacterium]
MCGIVGGISERNVVPIILTGLSHLEYRGYDSVGVAIINSEAKLERKRVTGRVSTLADLCNIDNLKGYIGIGHTRWATHGLATTENAHPHFSNNKIALVHNGIIENYMQLKTELEGSGYIFESQTDTEVIVHLVHFYSMLTNNLLQAVQQTFKRLQGAYALGIINVDNPNEIICVKYGSPLVIGVGINEMYFASDVSALLPVTNKVIYLEDGDIGVISLNDYKIYNAQQLVSRKVKTSDLVLNQIELGSFRHYMQKEIFEQPQAILDTIHSVGNQFESSDFGINAPEVFNKTEQILILACGTSLNAGHVAKYWLEEYAKLSCSIEIASEFRYSKIVTKQNTLVINISQSGETADTIASVNYAHDLGMVNTLSICNVPESTLVRLSKLGILTKAGREIGVASTKAFTTQLIILLYLTFTLAKARKLLAANDEQIVLNEIRRIPGLINEIFKQEEQIINMAKSLSIKSNALFLARNSLFPIANEGALKLKEISYIHAEAYAAGELKHGPLALIDDNMPSIILMPQNNLLSKMRSNIQEILARKGQVYLFTDVLEDNLFSSCTHVIHLPTADVNLYLLPILYIIPLQLLAYHTAVLKGTDIDKPRNLAKSVTVE